jgi:hypothetical protein
MHELTSLKRKLKVIRILNPVCYMCALSVYGYAQCDRPTVERNDIKGIKEKYLPASIIPSENKKHGKKKKEMPTMMNIKTSAKRRGHITEEAEPHLFQDKGIPDLLDIHRLFESKQPILLLPMETESPVRPRTRAKKACLSCNSRRVRCTS